MTALPRLQVPEEEQRRNDRVTRPLVVLATLVLLACYAYLFTHVADSLGVPGPRALFEGAGLAIEHVFDDDGNVDSALVVHYGDRLETWDDERLVLLAVVAGAFLCAYFLPLPLKTASSALWCVAGLLILCGVQRTAGLVLGHQLVWAVFHPSAVRRHHALLAGFLGTAVLSEWVGGWWLAVALPGLALLVSGLWRALRALPRDPRIGRGVRLVVVQVPLLALVAGAITHGLGGARWAVPVGFLLLFWQWERLMVYRADHDDGLIPATLPFLRYLSVFVSPAALPNWSWAPCIGQGYSYLASNLLAEEKNRLVVSGLRLWCVALLYLVLGQWILATVVEGFGLLGVRVYPFLDTLVEEHVHGVRVSTPTVLLTSLIDLLEALLVYGGVLHFKVGIWRILGYRVDPYYNRPWQATNLVRLWSRFAFHYREFLVRVFYYPVFLRRFRNHLALRIVTATAASAAFGNLVWGHLPDRLLLEGASVGALGHVLSTWPYFVLLAAAISLTELYLLRPGRSRRRPWTLDRRLPLDVLAAWACLQFFGLIHVFARPTADGTLADYARLFGIGLGLPL